MEEEDDDFYAPNDDTPGVPPSDTNAIATNPPPALKQEKNGAGLEDGEEEGEEVEEDESDSDIDIITERKDGSKPEPTTQPSRHITVKNAPAPTASAEHAAKTPVPVARADTPTKATPLRSGADYPPVRTSTIDLDAKPIYEPTGKPITAIDMDADLAEEDKPWRRPGSDMTDYFNYGFDEFTWASYCLKQETLRKEVSDQKKQMEDMQSFLGMPGVPGMAGPPGTAQPGMAMPPMPGMADMPPEMQQVMAAVMAQGIDPSQMDPAVFMQQMQQMQQGGQGGAQAGNPGGGFGGAAQSFGGQGSAQQQQQQQQQQMGFGFDQGMGGNRNRAGNFGAQGRGASNRRNW